MSSNSICTIILVIKQIGLPRGVFNTRMITDGIGFHLVLLPFLFVIYYYCCGATEGSEQQHNQDLKEIYKGRRILEFITFYHNALHLTRVHCATNNSNKNTGKFGG